MRYLPLILLAAGAGFAQDVRRLQSSFENPPDDARVMMRWWWFGPAVTKAGLEREMRMMKAGGLGGFEVQPVYPIALDDPARKIRNLPYLSPDFLDALRFTASKSRELGLRMDLTLGSGWPFGGAQVPITEASARLRWERVRVAPASRRIPLPAVGNGEQLIGAFQGGGTREYTAIGDGALWLPDNEPLPDELWFFISSRTGQQVKRPAVDADGFVLNHYDRAALDHYLRSTGDPQMQALESHPPFAIFCDSLEVYGGDWTPDFLVEFQRRRGYDLRPHLPLLAAGQTPLAADIRHDWGRTLTEVFEDRFLKPMAAYAKTHKTRFRIQGYGIPPMTVSSNSLADLPEGEGAQWKVVRASRWASSAAHIFNKPVTSSETWTWLHSPSFRATPLDIKAEADIHFIQGVNQLIGHGWPYMPAGEAWPGTRFYAAAVFNDANPWWPVMPQLARYLQRLSHLLRQGQPAHDVALYLPNADAYAGFSPGSVHLIESLREHVGPRIMPQILESGYGLDFFDDGSLAQAGAVIDGALRLGPNSYRVVVLPGVERIPLATFRTLEKFAGGGGRLVAVRRLPERAPGFMATEAEQAEVRSIATRLFEGPSAQGRFVAREEDLGAALVSLLPPDVRVTSGAEVLGFEHRKANASDIYFLANTGNQPLHARATFRVAGLKPEWWNPMTGAAHAATVQAGDATTTTLQLDLEPYESRVVVFSKRAQALPAAPQFKAAGEAIDLSRDWQVTFQKSAQRETMDTLRSWTGSEATRFYSGMAAYEKQFNLPAPTRAAGRRFVLDFGPGTALPVVQPRNGSRTFLDAPIREAAVVEVNGKLAGTLWCPPYTLDVTALLQTGANRLRISVANTAINHLAGQRLPDYRLLNLRYGVRFEPQDMNNLQPVPSGILSPVRLVPMSN